MARQRGARPKPTGWGSALARKATEATAGSNSHPVFLGFHALARNTSCTLGGSAHNGDLDGYAKPYSRNTDTSRIVRAWNYRSARYDLQNGHRPL